jgi:site-specific recombinase XerD
MTMSQILDEFIISRVMSGLVEKTVKDYREFCNIFVREVGVNYPYEELTQEHINRYIYHLMERPVSKTTIATYIRHFKIFLKWCHDNHPTENFDYKKIKVPKSPKKNVFVYSEDDIREIFSNIDADKEWIVMRNSAIVALMLDSGLRQAENTRILVRDVDFQRKIINVHGKGEKDRVVPLGNMSASYIKRYMSLCPAPFKIKDYLFVTRDMSQLTTNAVKLMVTKLAHKLPFDLSSHKLRHNFATNYCLDQYEKYGQIDIYQLMYLLGHEDVKTTSRYLHFAYEFIATKRSISHVDNVFLASAK